MTEVVTIAPVAQAGDLKPSTPVVLASSHTDIVRSIETELDIAEAYIAKLFEAKDVWLFVAIAFVDGVLTRFI